jgi:hypothetical protein
MNSAVSKKYSKHKEQDRNRIKTYLMLAGLVSSSVNRLHLSGENNRNKQKTNILLRPQKGKSRKHFI